MLKAANIPNGTFTSPHLIDRWDCISINGRSISESVFREVEDQVLSRNRKHEIDASEFELLTCTAYEIFNREKVQVGVVECGMGGLEDATNTLERPLATVISTIGLDHERFLGPTIQDIARHKAGIMKNGSACIVSRQPSEASEIIKSVANSTLGDLRSSLRTYEDDSVAQLPGAFGQHLRSSQLSDVKKSNMWCAYQAFDAALPSFIDQGSSTSDMLDRSAFAMLDTSVPARQQPLDLRPLMLDSVSQRQVLLDGAHNQDSWNALAEYLHRDALGATSTQEKVTWVIALSDGKSVNDFATTLVRDGDYVVAVRFGPVDGMPWVKPMDTGDIVAQTHQSLRSRGAWGSLLEFGGADQVSLLDALREAYRLGGESKIVIAGSLYLASDVLRLLRDVEQQGGIGSFESAMNDSDDVVL
ncbi:MAG: folylpolyglutamate synthase [Chrysothrix sp. TS-e1954]|nr:MAG: folylpolyglutamate synthase [Chrysothrix sp. TS-e1954]